MFYDYKCTVCNVTFEVKRDMNDGSNVVCPKCGHECHRVYAVLQWIWAGSVYRPDGSLRDDNDYAVLKG